MYQGCNSRGVFSKLSNFPHCGTWKVGKFEKFEKYYKLFKLFYRSKTPLRRLVKKINMHCWYALAMFLN